MNKPAIPYELVEEFAQKHIFRDATLIYPALLEPDTRFGAKFKTGIRFDSEEDPDLVSLIEQMDEIRDSFAAAAIEAGHVKQPKKGDVARKEVSIREVDEDDENNDEVFVTAECKATDHKGNDLTIPVVDAAKNPIPRNTAIGGGTVANVVVSLRPWYMPTLGFGCSIRLQAAQVTKIRTGRQQVDVDSEFDVVEGGFTAAMEEDSDGDF